MILMWDEIHLNVKDQARIPEGGGLIGANKSFKEMLALIP